MKDKLGRIHPFPSGSSPERHAGSYAPLPDVAATPLALHPSVSVLPPPQAPESSPCVSPLLLASLLFPSISLWHNDAPSPADDSVLSPLAPQTPPGSFRPGK